MAQLTAKDITNLYLYGQELTPTNLVDSSLIRPENAVTEFDVDVKDFMETGAGRFAVGSQFELVQRFFLLPAQVPPGTYTKLQLAEDIFGLGPFGAFSEGSIAWNMQQFNYDDGANDYLDRVWVYNSMAFQISDDALFIVEENGEKRIENFAVYPRTDVQDNFDFETGNLPTAFANAVVLPSIDPSGIGRKVNINFSNFNLLSRKTYTEESFANDFQKSKSWNVSTLAALARLASASDEFVERLFNDGVTRFLDRDKPILYGTVGEDNISAVRNITTGSTPTLYEFKDNGAVILGGEGTDTISGGLYSDVLIGNEGNDKLNGQPFLTDSSRGSDILDGGAGNDTLDGSKGKEDIAVFSDKFENYEYSISESGIFGFQKTITFAHNKGTRTDGTDTLENLEFAQFSDRTVPLPLEDGPKDTKQTGIFDNNGQLFASASLTLPTFMFDGDADYTINLSSSEQDFQYNFAYIIDVSGSMYGTPLQAAKDAYVSLTNSLIDSGVADVSQFVVIPFSSSASLNGPFSPTQAISTIQGLSAGGGTTFSSALDRAHQFFSGLPEGGTNVAYFISDGYSSGSFSSSASLLQSVADVRAYGIGNADLGQLNIVDSNNAVLLSNPSDLEAEFNNSGFSLDDIAKIDIFLDGTVVQTIQSDQLIDSPLGLSFSDSVESLSVALDAENLVTAEVFFANGSPSATVDLTVTSGQGYIASLDRGGTLALSAAPTTNALSAEASDSSNDNRISQNSTTSSTEASPLSNILNGTSGNDLIRLGAVDLGANAGEGGDKVVGNNFNNVLDGGSGNDTIFGHDGDDTIITGNGEDRIDGGDGIDTVVYADRLLANSSVQKVGKVITVDNTDTLTNVEFVQFSDTRISTENLQAVPVLKGSDLTFTEGNSSNTIARFTFNLSAPAPVDVQFSYNTLEGTALAGSDYIATSGQVTIAAGESSATIEVEVIGDTEFEPAEVFALSLSGLSGATFENNEAEYIVVANVENDDPLNTPPSTTGIGDITVTENAPNSIVDLFAAFEDAEESDAALTYSIEGNTNNGVFDSVTIDGVTGTLTLDYADKAISNADLTVRATDSEGKFVDTTFTVSVIAAGNGKDVLFGSNGNDYLDGGNGKDEIFGLGGNDRLIGGNSNDLLRGGEGNDLLKGGNGKDVFVLAVGEGTDIIEDFKSRNDSLGLAGSLTFRQLTIGQENDNTLVSLTESGEVLAILNGINSSSIGSKDFTYAI